MHPSRSHRLQRHQPPYLLSLLSLLFAHPGRPPHWTCFLWDEPSLSFTCKASLLPSLFLPLAGSSSNPRLSLDLCSFGQASSSPGLSPQWLVVNPGVCVWGGCCPSPVTLTTSCQDVRHAAVTLALAPAPNTFSSPMTVFAFVLSQRRFLGQETCVGISPFKSRSLQL